MSHVMSVNYSHVISDEWFWAAQAISGPETRNPGLSRGFG